jgi:hypothetical protein
VEGFRPMFYCFKRDFELREPVRGFTRKGFGQSDGFHGYLSVALFMKMCFQASWRPNSEHL